MTGSPERTSLAVPVAAGIVAALVGFTSAFAVVLAGLRAVGADEHQAASGLLAVTATMGLASCVLSWRHRMPLTSAWSTPGAALLVATGALAGGWSAAVGAFVVTGALLLLTAMWPALAGVVARIPAHVAQAMLAGVLLPLCLQPVLALAAEPASIVPVVLVWLGVALLAPRWAAPASFAAALVVIVLALTDAGPDASQSWPAVVPRVELTAPTLDVAALTSVAVPLYLVTMASQNIPGAAVMRSYGYDVPWRSALGVTGAGSLLGAIAGGHAINLAAISASLVAAPEADPDPQRRWVAGLSSGLTCLVLALASPALAAVVLLAPDGVLQAVAGLALLTPLVAALSAATADVEHRLTSGVTIVVAASGVTLAGVGAAFWALAAGVLLHLASGLKARRAARSST